MSDTKKRHFADAIVECVECGGTALEVMDLLNELDKPDYDPDFENAAVLSERANDDCPIVDDESLKEICIKRMEQGLEIFDY